jgi:crotonobetainyl-CoA:carnitine CoA-transferase CaiB-like acyl-CoA transferase
MSAPGQGGPLRGLRVLDATGVIVGPTATLLLAEQGADVIKVEPPGGDMMRKLGGRAPANAPGMSPKFLHFNRNKRSIVLDLKTAAGQAVMHRLAATSDVFISNMRARALVSLGLDAASMAALNPRLVHCTISGFASGGPYDGAPAYDTIIQGLSGVADCFRRAMGEPRFAPFVLTDHIVGIMAAQAICAALIGRGPGGPGQAIEVPMFENAAAFVLSEHLGQRTYGPSGAFGDPRIMTPDARPLPTLDGYICVSANTDAQARGFFDAIERPDLKDDARFGSVTARLENVADYFRLRAEAMMARTTDEWLPLLRRHDVPAMRCNTLDSLLDDPQLRGSGTLVEEASTEYGEEPMLGLRHANRYSRSGTAPPRLAPKLDEHAEEILRELGFSAEESAGLRQDAGALS